jgi:hypothetical protein
MRGGETGEGLVQEAKGAVSQLYEQRGSIYRTEMAKIGADKTVLSYDSIDKAVNNTVKVFEGKSISPSVEKIQSSIRAAVEDWKSGDPKIYSTPAGMDALKQKIGDIRDATQYGSPERRAANDVYGAIRSTIVDAVPAYDKIMRGYETATQEVKEAEKTLSLNPKASIDTSLRKITSALRDNVSTNYGRRAELIEFLSKSGAPNLFEKVAGYSLKEAMPRGLARGAAVGVGEAALTGGIALGHLPAAAAAAVPAALAASPRVVGETAHKMGQARRVLPGARPMSRAARLLNQLRIERQIQGDQQ